MINVLFGFFITCMIIASLIPIINIVHKTTDLKLNEDIFIAIKQISKYTLTRNLEINGDSILFDEFTIYLDDNRIVKTPGFEVLLFDVDDLYFSIEDNKVYISINRDNKIYKSLINYEL